MKPDTLQKKTASGQFIRRYCPERALFDRRRIHAPWLATALERFKAVKGVLEG